MVKTEEDSQVRVLADGALESLEVGDQATANTDNVLTADPAKAVVATGPKSEESSGAGGRRASWRQ